MVFNNFRNVEDKTKFLLIQYGRSTFINNTLPVVLPVSCNDYHILTTSFGSTPSMCSTPYTKSITGFTLNFWSTGGVIDYIDWLTIGF